MMVLLMMSSVRELLGSGTLLGYDVLGPRFEPWVIMVLPPGGFFTLGAYLLLDHGRACEKPQPQAQFILMIAGGIRDLGLRV